VVLDTGVWIGRILVTIVIVLAWDAYHAGGVNANAGANAGATGNNRTANRIIANDTKTVFSEDERGTKSNNENNNNNNNNEESPTRNRSVTIAETTTVKNASIGSVERDSDKTEEASPVLVSCGDVDNHNNSSCDSNNDNDRKDETFVAAASIEPSASLSPTTNSNTSSNNNNIDTTPSFSWDASVCRASHHHHPGMEGFLHWYEVQNSLYRIYTLGYRGTESVAVPPYAPNSHRGRIPIEMVVSNQTNQDINVFWVDYQGKHVRKGSIRRRTGVWNQTTYIDHPWVFEDATTGKPYLYYIPYRAIPSIPKAPTIGADGTTGLHKFALVENTDTGSSPYHIGIDDAVLPFPGATVFDNQPLRAIQWTLDQMSRDNNASDDTVLFRSSEAVLQKYLLNILKDPSNARYRGIRISSQRFRPIWASSMRGLLLAIGFVEAGAYCTLGLCDACLSKERLQDVALLSYMLSEWARNEESQQQQQQQQPTGASDGFGRAGFGRAGTIN